jgi:uncharacterized protein
MPMSKSTTVACPHCGTSVVWTPEARWRPFCSERCKLIDFGGWASEAYRVSTAEVPELESGAPPDESSGRP